MRYRDTRNICPPESKRLKIDPEEHSQMNQDLEDIASSDSETSSEPEQGDLLFLSIPHVPELISQQQDCVIEIPGYTKLKEEDRRWESKPRFTHQGYKYSLIVRPNGLKYNEGYGECIGIWLKALPSDRDEELGWPARVKLSLRVKSFSSSSEYEKDLTIAMKEYSWEQHATKFRYPAFNFGLTAIKNGTVERAQCVFNDTLTIIVLEG